jgi:Cancer susceptibility candidate 1 N-terminus
MSGKKKKGGKKKKSAKQRAAELEEQREQARLAELEALQQQEAYEIERLKRIENEKSSYEQELAAENERLNSELESDLEWRKELSDKQAAFDLKHKQQEEWNEYIACNPLPDPHQEADLNAHMTLWSIDQEQEPNACTALDETLDVSNICDMRIDRLICSCCGIPHSLTHSLPSFLPPPPFLFLFLPSSSSSSLPPFLPSSLFRAVW